MQQELCFCSLPCLPGLCTRRRRQPPRFSYSPQRTGARAGFVGWCRSSRKIENSGGHVCRAESRTWSEGTAADDGPSWWRKACNLVKYRNAYGYLAGSEPFEGIVFTERGQVLYDQKSDFNKRVRILQHAGFRVLRLQQTLHSIAVVDTYNYDDPATAPILPDKLVLGYIRAMVVAATSFCALLASPSGGCDLRTPGQSVFCIGVGGGSLPLFLARSFPLLAFWVVEIDPVVLHAAQQLMGLDRARVQPWQAGAQAQEAQWQPGLTIQLADAHDVMADLAERIHHGTSAGQSAILMDAYDGDQGIPLHLRTPKFMQLCACCLHPQGALVVNLFNGYAFSPERDATLAFIANARQWFEDVYTIKVADSNCNVVMVATKPKAAAWQAQLCSVYGNGAVPDSTTARVVAAGATEGRTVQSVQSPDMLQQGMEGVRSRCGGSSGSGAAGDRQAADNRSASGTTKGAAAAASFAFRALSVESSALPTMIVRCLRRGGDEANLLTSRAIMSTAHEMGREVGFDFDAVDEIRDVFTVSVDADGAIVELRA